MKLSLYPKLAVDGIRKNKRLYLPFILTCIGMVMMHYIITFLRCGEFIEYLPGASILRVTLGMGSIVIAMFACIFLFYTNSFLIRRRKKEFGLYNILGMEKKHIGIILAFETLFTFLIAILCGLVFGIAFSKAAELLLCNMLNGDISFSFKISYEAVLMNIGIFAVIFFLLYLNSLRQIKASTAVSLIKSESEGEKAPKANPVIGIVGVLLLFGAYYMAVTIKEPLSALTWFFAAVIMVIVGTYLVMISGSVTFCRLLQKNKKYYYNKKHFVSVSSLVYRMKRNGAGLASICVLATMVLVMISSSGALYFGVDNSINARYPTGISVSANLPDSSEKSIAAARAAISDTAQHFVKEYNAEEEGLRNYTLLSAAGVLQKNKVELYDAKIGEILAAEPDSACILYLVTLDDYNKLTNKNETLNSDEALVYKPRNPYKEKTVEINGIQRFKVKESLSEFIKIGDAAANIASSVYVVLPDRENVATAAEKYFEENNAAYPFNTIYRYEFNTNLESEKEIDLKCDIYDELSKKGENRAEDDMLFTYLNCESRAENKADFLSSYGGLFFLGIFLSIVFIFAAVLIIYYKQISEGYEDASRFEIMQNVGMTKKEIKRSINSQLLTVFYLPLLLSGVHLAFAFPIIRKILLLLNLTNISLFFGITVISFVAFALFYAIVYKLTSNAYYKIVSEHR